MKILGNVLFLIGVAVATQNFIAGTVLAGAGFAFIAAADSKTKTEKGENDG